MKHLSLISASLLTLLLSTQALAETDNTGFYVGGAINNIKLGGDGDDEESGVGLGFYGGYNFNHWFGLESNLFFSGDLGDSEVDVAAGAMSFTPKFTLQFNEVFSGYAKVGLASMAVVLDTEFADFDFSGIGWSYGLGLNAAVSEHLNIRLSYDVTRGDLDSNDFGFFDIDNIDTEIKQLALGMHYQF